MTGRTTWIGGALAASLAAGPIAVALMALAAVATEAHGIVAVLGLILFFALPIGLTISLLPNVLATALLVWAGSRHAWARHPAVWATCGVVLAWVIAALFTGEPDLSNAVLSLVGLPCALICRYGVRWADDPLSSRVPRR